MLAHDVGSRYDIPQGYWRTTPPDGSTMPSTSHTSTTSAPTEHAALDVDAEQRRRVINRLKRLEGQVRGLQGMIEEGRSCREVLTLLAGIRSALNATGDVILESYVQGCLTEPGNRDETLHDLVHAVKLARG